MTRSITAARLVAAGAAALLLVAPGLSLDASGALRAPGVVYVSTNAKAQGKGASCATARFGKIQQGLDAVASGGVVLVCAGTYRGKVTLGRPVSLTGENATIDARGLDTGITVASPRSTVSGFTVKGAIGEGILVAGRPSDPMLGVEIRDNTIEGNDGEGIHLMTAFSSLVLDNTVKDNAGGILVSDELGPSAHNMIEGNTVIGNELDGGITLAGQSKEAYAKGRAAAFAGGVYDNTVSGNTIIGNGTKGHGAGVLLATGLRGGAVYDNTVQANMIRSNGLAGVTVQAGTAEEDLNGNVVEDNTIAGNNLRGDRNFKSAVDLKTTAVIVASSSSPIAITISHNSFSDDAIGVWTTGPVKVTGLATNARRSVAKLSLSAAKSPRAR